jgi:hypothetical protein
MTPSDMHAFMLRLQWLPHSKAAASLALSEGHALFHARTAADNLPILYTIAPASQKPEHDDGAFIVVTTTGRSCGTELKLSR